MFWSSDFAMIQFSIRLRRCEGRRDRLVKEHPTRAEYDDRVGNDPKRQISGEASVRQVSQGYCTIRCGFDRMSRKQGTTMPVIYSAVKRFDPGCGENWTKFILW